MHIRDPKLFDQLVKIKEEINQQIPLAANRYEEFECVPAYRHLTEEEQYVFEEDLAKKSAQHDQYIHSQDILFEIYESLNQAFKNYLSAENIAEPSQASSKQQAVFSTQLIQSAEKIYYQHAHTQQFLGNRNHIDLNAIEKYLAQHQAELVQTLFQGKPLKIADEDLQRRCEIMKKLVEHRQIAKNQIQFNRLQGYQSHTDIKRAYYLAAGVYYQRIHTDVGFCDEHACLAIIKIVNTYLESRRSLEKVSLTYLDEDGHENDGHTFLVVNRDPNSQLNRIETWGHDAILFDAWNKLVCYAEDFFSLPLQYFNYPEGATWSTLLFSDDTFTSLQSIQKQDQLFIVAGLDTQAKRDELLVEEYQLIAAPTQCHDFLMQLLNKNIPQNFRYQFDICLTNRGQHPIRVLYGFDLPKIAIHIDYLKNLSTQKIYALEFGLARALYFIKHFAVRQEDTLSDADQLSLDKKTLAQFKCGAAAIDYLRDAHQFEESHKEYEPFRLEDVISAPIGLSGIGLHYLQRIKNIQLLQAQDETYRVVYASHPLQNEFLKIHATLINLFSTITFFQDFHLYATAVKKILYLKTQLPLLKVELYPYELSGISSIRVKQFCVLIRKINIDLKDATQLQAVHELVEHAYALKIPAFEVIYLTLLNIPDDADRDSSLNIRPLGPFKRLQEYIDHFVSATQYQHAKEALQKFLSLDQELQVHYAYMHIHSESQAYLDKFMQQHNQLPQGDQRYFGSTIGWHVQWKSFENTDWDLHLAWCAENQDISMAKMLWRVGVIRDPRLWRFFTFRQMISMIEGENFVPPLVTLSGHLASFGEDRDFKKMLPSYLQFQSQNHVLQPCGLDSSDHFEQAYLDFYEANLPALISPQLNLNTDNETIRFMLEHFTRIALTSSECEKKVVKSFFLGREDHKDLKHLQEEAKAEFGNALVWGMLYTEFFIMQCYGSTHFRLFTLAEIMQAIQDYSIDIDKHSIPSIAWIHVFQLNHQELTLDCLKQLLPLLGQHNLYFLCPAAIKNHLAQYGYYDILSEPALLIFKWMKLYFKHLWLEHSRPIITKMIWPSTITTTLALDDVIYVYRLLDLLLCFPDTTKQTLLGDFILAKLDDLSSDHQLLALEKILIVDENQFSMPISNLMFRNQVVDRWVKLFVAKYGIDKKDIAYEELVIEKINALFEVNAHRDMSYLFNQLSIAVVAQQKIADGMGSLLEPKKYFALDDTSKKEYIALNTLSAVCSALGKNHQDQVAFLDYLSSLITDASVTAFVNYLETHYLAQKLAEIFGYSNPHNLTPEAMKHIIQLAYHMFWERNLEERAIVINYLLMPPKSVVNHAAEIKAYDAALCYVAKKIFPQADDEQSDEHLALAFLIAYLQTADAHLRNYLLSAIIVTSNQASQIESPSVGRKLALLCEHLGPAYVKVAQAIHSHPATSLQIKQDLDHVKGRSNPPTRWDLWRLYLETVPLAVRESISYVGELLGSASYHLALSIKFHNGTEAVLLLLRENAEKQATAGFAHLQKTVMACQHPRIESHKENLREMLEEASELSTLELDHHAGDLQHRIAESIYSYRQPARFKMDGYDINVSTAQTSVSGPGFRVLNRMPGTEFNDFVSVCKNKKVLKAICKAVLKIELTNILSGAYFDCDRHGNQLRIVYDEKNQVINLGLYDFGEMSLSNASLRELNQLEKVLADFPRALQENISFDSLLQTHIQQCKKTTGASAKYLMRIRKSFLAMQDFQKHLSPADFFEVMLSLNSCNRISVFLEKTYHSVITKIKWMKMKEVVRSGLSFADNINLFGIKKHHLNRPQQGLVMTNQRVVPNHCQQGHA